MKKRLFMIALLILGLFLLSYKTKNTPQTLEEVAAIDVETPQFQITPIGGQELKESTSPSQLENEEPCFTYGAIPQEIRDVMLGQSMPETEPIAFEELAFAQVSYIGFDDLTYTGQIIVHQSLAAELVEIFEELYMKQYPIEQIKLIDYFEANDAVSMANNNSSAFCYRVIEGTTRLSKHSQGYAIDINPLQNPHVTKNAVYPVEGEAYADRTLGEKGMIQKGDACYEAFTKRGWQWGGDWQYPDYQHFEKILQ